MSNFMSPFWLPIVVVLATIIAIALIARSTGIFRTAYWYPTTWDRIKAWWAGRRDGTDGLLSGKYKQHLIEKAAHFIQIIAAIAGDRDTRLAGRGRYENAGEAAARAQQQIADTRRLIQKQGLEGVHSGKRNVPYWLTMIAVGLGEFVFNAVAFQVLGGTRSDTYLMVLTLAIALPGAAHLLGLFVKQSDQRIKNGAVGLALGTVALGCMYSINLVRAESVNSSSNSSAFIQASPMTYYSMNLLVFIFAIALSYFHHEQHSLLSTQKNWQAKFSKANDRFARLVRARNDNLGYHTRWMQSIGHRTIILCETYDRAYLRSYRRAHDDCRIEDDVGSIWSKLIATLTRDEHQNTRTAGDRDIPFAVIVAEYLPNWPEQKGYEAAFNENRKALAGMSSPLADVAGQPNTQAPKA